jgi:hypothetical protein
VGGPFQHEINMLTTNKTPGWLPGFLFAANSQRSVQTAENPNQQNDRQGNSD